MNEAAAPTESKSLPVFLICVTALCWLVTVPLWMIESRAFARYGGDTNGIDLLQFIVPALVGSSLVVTAGTWFALVGYGQPSSRIRLLAFAALMALPASPAAAWALKGHFWYVGSLGLAGLIPFAYAAFAPRPTFPMLLRVASLASSMAFVLPMLIVTWGQETSVFTLVFAGILIALPAAATTMVFAFTRSAFEET
jgi:hypothetical protein